MARPPEGDPGQTPQQRDQLLQQFGKIVDRWRPGDRRRGGILMQHIIDMGARPIDRPDIPDHYRVPIFEIPGNEQDASIRVRIYSDGFHLGENKFSTADLRGVEAITEVFGHALDFLRQRRATVARLAPPTR